MADNTLGTLQLVTVDANNQLTLTTVSDTHLASLVLARAENNGSDAPADTVDTELLGRVYAQGYADSGYRNAAYIGFAQQGASSGAYVPGMIRFYTGTAAAVPGLAVTINSDKSMLCAGPITSTQFKLSALNTAPANAGAAGTAGEVRIDANAIYVCTATNTWKKIAIATW